MLILTRKRDDSIKIGEDIVIRVMRTARGSVKIGIEAPASIRIVRGELNEFSDLAGGSNLADPADHADLHDEDCDEDRLHEQLNMHSAYDLEMVMQH